MGGGVFSNINHLRTLREERRDGQKEREVANEIKLKGLFRYLKGTKINLILRSKITGAWLSVYNNTFLDTVFYATEFRYLLCARYNIYPLNPQSHCDGCGTTFWVTCTLSCSTGAMVIACHKEICDKLLYLSQRAFRVVSSPDGTIYLVDINGTHYWGSFYGTCIGVKNTLLNKLKHTNTCIIKWCMY